MKFTTARLCGGKALMAISADELDIDMDAAAEKVISEGFPISTKDDMMITFQWNGMETTLYKQGKVMFFPLEDKQLCIKYATQILESL
ncbi:MAG: hypothetical protein IJX35_01415 [Candidatus Methanomethylophilaceae archaeon]|nr:hypothetical protein [Candidatus Methanomethylophilaceae archaeon]